ncbi:MAG TPA: N-6 DNA methylase, partial [bacterium]
MPNVEALRAIKTFPSLVKYLRDELDWPIESDDFEDLTFDYEPEELGIDAKTAAKIESIKQLRPLVSNQPWGIFFIKFEPKRLPVVALRRILRSLIIKKRQSSGRADRATWQLNDLLFISAYGEEEHRDVLFANFTDDSDNGDLPTLKVLGWDDEDTAAHLGYTHQTLKEKLRWPDEPQRLDEWRTQWSEAFTLRHREVITTSKQLAIQLAALARAIRKRVNAILAIESDKGPMRKQMAAFREALIHDLKEDDFADMYAQTITYGLLTARVSRPAALVADNLADMVPVTNPFLRDLLSTFLTIGGRKGKIDFDELGINDVVQLLRDANMEAVLLDFGDRNPQEDPVIHFYELFLKEYDAQKRIKRGVFYTPRPVVSFIVRSVDELLRKEFGLQDGLADTATWGDMLKKHAELKLPDGVKPDDPFVQILDPACGTGTFLVEVIEVIYQTMTAKWRKERKMELELP